MTILRRQHTIPIDGLVREWLLDGSGLDSSGSGANLTIANLGYEDTDKGYQKKRPLFTASSTAYGSPFQRANGQELAISVWIRRTSSGTYQDIVVNRDGSYYNYMLYIHATGDKIGFHGTAQNAGSYTPPLNTWTHIVAQVSAGQQLTIWINGVLTDTVNGYTYQAQTPAQMNIGQFANTEHFLGNIQGVRVYDRILTAEDIRNLYLEGSRLLGFAQGPTSSSSLDYTRMDFATDDTQTNGWTRRTYGGWGVSGGNLYTSPNDGRVWTGKNYPGLPGVGSVLKTKFLADTDVWGHNCSHEFGTDTNNPKVTFSIYAVTYSGHPPSLYVYGQNGAVAYWNATGISAGTWYVMRSEITATGYKFQIWNATETTLVQEYILTDTIYPFVQVSMGQGTGNHSYMDWLEASIYSNVTNSFTGKYLPEEFGEGLEFLYTGKNVSNSVYDQSGKGIVGTAANVAFAAQNGKGLYPMTFNGSSSNIALGSPTFLGLTTSPIMVTILCKFNASVAQGLFCKGIDSAGGWGFGIFNDVGGVIKTGAVTSGAGFSSPGFTYETGRYYVIQGYWNPTTMKVGLYVNGAFIGETSTSSGTLRHGGTSQIGMVNGTSYPSNADILLVAGHSKILTAKQCRRIFTSLFTQ